jgi:PadR family transcriptional regulator, regulatory protein AphA
MYRPKQTMSTPKDTAPVEAPIRLSPISFVVLGVIGLRGPSTPYQLKQAIERSVKYFWPFPHSQLYGEPERLAREGLLDQEVEEGGRRRRVYSLTPSGQEALESWLKTPPGEVFEMRDMAVLQLFFSEFASTAELVKLAEDQVRLHKERLAVYQAIIEHNQEREGAARRLAPLDLGVRMTKACLEFWSDIAENPPPGRE